MSTPYQALILAKLPNHLRNITSTCFPSPAQDPGAIKLQSQENGRVLYTIIGTIDNPESHSEQQIQNLKH